MAALPRPAAVAVTGALLAALVGLTVVAARRSAALRATWPPEADTFYLPTARTLRTLSLGHHELAADLVAARTNVYFGTQLSQKAPQRWLERYIDTAVDLDPLFRRVYLAGPAMLIYGGGAVTIDKLESANRLLRRGVEAFPLLWELSFQLGFNLLFELPKLAGEDDPRVSRWRDEGVERLRQAAMFEDVPYWMPGLVARMLTKRGSDELALRHLEQAYAVATSEQARQQIYFKIQSLRGSQRAAQLEEERRRFKQLLDERYPYAPDAFSVAAGPRRDRSVDLGGARPAP